MKKRINLTEALKAFNNYDTEARCLRTCKKSNPGKDYSTQEAKLQDLREGVLESSKKIIAELEQVQHRCTARTITIWDIFCMVDDIEKKLSISKKALEGCSFRCDMNAQSFPNAYKYTPESTGVVLEVHSGKWYLTNIGRGKTEKIQFEATLTSEAKEAIIRNHERF